LKRKTGKEKQHPKKATKELRPKGTITAQIRKIKNKLTIGIMREKKQCKRGGGTEHSDNIEPSNNRFLNREKRGKTIQPLRASQKKRQSWRKTPHWSANKNDPVRTFGLKETTHQNSQGKTKR